MGSWTCEPGVRAASKPHADLDAFHGLHGHHGLGQAAVELLVPLGVRAESVGQALDADLDDAAQRVAGLLAAIDQFGDLVVTIGIERVHDAAVAAGALFFERARLGAESPIRRPARRRRRP